MESNSPSMKERTTTDLQIRLLNGETIRQQFSVHETLEEVRNFIDTKIQIRRYTILTRYPHHVFSLSEESSTLAALHLVPSATLIITALDPPQEKPGNIPQVQEVIPRDNGGGWIQTGYRGVSYIFVNIFSIFYWIVNGFRQRPIQERAPQNNPGPAPSNQNQSGNPRSGSRVASLPSQDPNEERFTWNGNSTQQQ